MCMMAASIAVSVAQSAVSFMAAQQDYNARAKQWKQNYTNALASGRDEQKQLDVRMMEEQEAFAQKRHQNNIEGAKAKAQATVSAADAGVGGLNLDNILAGITRQVSQKQNADLTNYRMRSRQLSVELENTNTKIQNRINSVQRPTAPNPLGYVLQGIGGALSAASG